MPKPLQHTREPSHLGLEPGSALSRRRGAIATGATLAVLLGACGGESSSPPLSRSTATVAQAVDASKVGVDAYGAARTPGTSPALAPADALQASLALALPPLQDTVTTNAGPIAVARQAIVFPALQAARIDVLRAAAAGDTQRELESALPASANPGATRALASAVTRTLWAASAARFNRSFLAATDTGRSMASPWGASAVADWPSALADIARLGPVGNLNLRPDTRLVVGHHFSADVRAGAQAVSFEGVGVSAPDTWYVAPMLALEGPGGVVTGDDFAAVATWIGDHLWVSLRPPGDAPLFQGLAPATLNRALSAAWSAHPSPDSATTRSRQVWPQLATEIDDRSRLPQGIALPYDELRANLSGLDGGGTYLTESARNASLEIGIGGLRASGTQVMAFSFSASNQHGGGSYGSVTTTLLIPSLPPMPPRCPRASADWRGAYLALIDRSGRVLLVASLPAAPGGATACSPS